MKFWPATEIADTPGMHPHAAHELRQSAATNSIDSHAVDAAYVAVANGMTIGAEVPISLQMNTAGLWSPVFTRRPDAFEFVKLERTGVIRFETGDYFFFAFPRN